MNAEAIFRQLKYPERYRITAVEEAVSTNSQVREWAERGDPAGAVLIADRQTGGRGRRGHTFFSPQGGVYLSLLLRPDEPAAETVRITVAAAVAGAAAAEAVFGGTVTIKWVNDLYQNGRKVAGILTEGEPNPETGKLNWAVLGVGFNVTPPPGGFPPDIAAAAGALCEVGTEGDRERLAAQFLNCFAEYRTLPWKTVLEEYRERSFLIGQTVTSLSGVFSGAAQVLDVDEEARLVVRHPDGKVFRLSSGEVSVRLSEKNKG